MSSKKMSAALVAWLAVVSQVLAGPALELKLSGADQYDGVDAFSVLATLTNTGDEHLSLYNEPMGILSKMPTNTFKVTKNGDSPRYVGPVVKYSYAKATSFTELDPGESVEIEHDLSRAYDFDGDGEYDIYPDTTFFYRNANNEPVEIQANLIRAHSAKLSGSLHSRALQKRQEDYHSLMKREATTSGCTSSQTSDIIESTWYASHYAASAEKHLTLNSASGTERYVYWFGEFDATNHETVLQHYTNIRTSDVKTYTYDCACEEGDDVFAYVYPDQFGHIYLCAQYMAADVTGTDSKAGTIIHESSHFTRNAGTRDVAYGHTRAHDLALTNGTLAVRNADSHEYFAENENPWLA